MDLFGLIQLILFITILVALTKPVGLYLVRVLDAERRTFLDPVMRPVERLFYRLFGLNPGREQNWKGYTVSILCFSLVGLLFTYAILRLQHLLPLNPQGLKSVNTDLAFNTAASFTTNTNWQNYGGESTLSYFSQMVGLTLHNFASAAVGIGVAAALVRGIARNSAKTIGNFWVDLVRINLYLLLPICFVFALFLVSQGVIQNFKPYQKAKLVDLSTVQAPQKDGSGQHFINEDRKQPTIIAQGPVASQAAIKMLGTNGGGFFNANAAHPYENPTPLSNFLQILSIFLIPSGLTYYLGWMVKKQQHGWAVWSAMAILFLVTLLVCWWAESAGNPRLHTLGVDPASGNMEGKEVRFGIFSSSLFATVTTAASCGAVNAMHDSFTPLGGLIPLFNMQLGEVVFGGVGAGLYGMLIFVILAVFLTGLMVGRTPEYLGKKIESYDVKVSVLALLVSIFSILGFSAWAIAGKWGLAGLNNSGPHGLTEILYAYSSATGNNGSAFAGLTGNTAWYNITLGLAMLVGRFLMIVPVMALAGNLSRKRMVPPSVGSFPAWGPIFTLVLVGTVLIIGALTFLPALALGPIVEHFLMMKSTLPY
ncbi:MAG: Potassium-transporting ATPase A chain [Syntrophorhabdus sp. PtaU1.Bin050]|nr:MAG: Potassium-transporting ATPase A chain [Syntrophorhabdus sp. PtaU1.Bin050]